MTSLQEFTGTSQVREVSPMMARRSVDTGISLKQISDEVNAATKEGALPSDNPPTLMKYLAQGQYSHLINSLPLRRNLSKIISGHANNQRQEQLNSILKSRGYEAYKSSILGSKSSLFKNLVTRLIQFITQPDSRKQNAAHLMQLMKDSKGVFDPNHPGLQDVRKNIDLSHLYESASSLGLFNEFEEIRQGILTGQDLKKYGLSSDSTKAEINFNMSEIPSLNQTTGSVTDGINVVLQAVRVSPQEADLINQDQPKNIVKPGETLNFYNWVAQIRQDALREDDAALSDTVNRFIDNFIAVQVMRSKNAITPERAEAHRETINKFRDFITSSAYGLPQQVLDLIQRGLAFREGFNANSFSALTAGADESIPEQTVADSLNNLRKAVDSRPLIFGKNANLDEIVDPNNKLNYYVLQNGRFVDRKVDISHKTQNGNTTFFDASKGYREIRQQFSNNTISEFTRAVMNQNNVDPEAINKFRQTHQEPFGKDPNVWNIRSGIKAVDLTNKTQQFETLISNLNLANGVSKQMDLNEAQSTIRETVIDLIKTVNPALQKTRTTDLDSVITLLNTNKPNNASAFNLSSLITAYQLRNQANIKSELDNLNNLLANLKIETNGPSKYLATARTPSEQTLALNSIYNKQNRDFFISLMNKHIHSDDVKSPIASIDSEKIQQAFSSVEELQEELLKGGRVPDTISSFEMLKEAPHKSGAEALIIFGQGIPKGGASEIRNVKLTAFLGVLSRIENSNRSDSQKERIIGDVVSTLFGDEIQKATESNSNLSQEELRRDKKLELVRNVREFLKSSKVNGYPILGQSKSQKIGVKIDELVDIAHYNNKQITNAEKNTLSGAIKNRLLALGVKDPRTQDITKTFFIKNKSGKFNINRNATFDVPQGAINSVAKASDLVLASTMREHFLRQAGRSVAQSAAEAPAEKLALKLDYFYNDGASSKRVFNHVRECLEQSMKSLDTAEGPREVMKNLENAISTGDNSERCKAFFQQLTGTKPGEFTDETRFDSYEDIESRMEQWLAFMTEVCYKVPDGYPYSAKETEQPRFKNAARAQEKVTPTAQKPSTERSEALTSQQA